MIIVHNMYSILYMVMKMIDFNERLKDLRKKCGISQSALARQMNLTRATVNAWEMGISTPNAQSLIMLSQYFKVSVDYLLGLDTHRMLDIEMLNEKEQKMICDMVRYLSEQKTSSL